MSEHGHNDRPRILVVEDDDGVRQTLRLILGRKGYIVETASTGQEGIDRARESSFEAALVDIKLPDMEGVELLQPLKKLHPHAGRIVMTGHASVRTAIQALNEGATAYVTKPLDVDPMLATIEEALEKQQLIEEKRRAEQALRELNATLEAKVQARTAEVLAERERTETILRNVSDAIVMTDTEGRLKYANPALNTVTGYTTEEIVGRPIDLLFEGPVAEQVDPPAGSILQTGERWWGEAKGRRRDGRTYDMALSLDPVHGPEGKLRGHVVSFRDISEEKALERARSRFLTNVSHQFRTPVATLKLQLTLMERSDLSNENHERLKTAQHEIDWLIELVEDVLKVASLDSGQAVKTFEPVPLCVLIESVKNRYLRVAEGKELRLDVSSLPAHPPAVRGDPKWLGRALGEVVENAVTYTPPGGKVRLALDTHLRRGRAWAVIEAQDDGPGIPPDEQERIFERFFRGTLAESGETPGIGLGLSIAQAIMHAHGGRVTVESDEAGSTFRLWLPVDTAGSG